MKVALVGLLVCGVAVGQGDARVATEKMAATVMSAWPAGVVATTRKPGEWGYEEGVLLDGLAAEWEQTANGKEFAYIKAAVDKYVQADGSIRMNAQGRAFAQSERQLDNIELGRSVLLVYRVTQQEKYAKAAKFLHDALADQPRNASGGYWHKQVYPNQMWLDGAFMAEPFRAAYAAEFQLPEQFNDIAKQFLLMAAHMRDPKTGLLRHGWDESKQMAWADKKTGLSPEVWARAVGWYCVGLVDTLDWFPVGAQREKLVVVLQKTMAEVVGRQDLANGLWWQILDKGRTLGDAHSGPILPEQLTAAAKGNFEETSASAMFVYSLAKGTRKGYLPEASSMQSARAGWRGLQRESIRTSADGTVTLTGTVKAAGLGGNPYRSGSYGYYVGEPTGDQDPKGVGAYLLAGSEMSQAETSACGSERDHVPGAKAQVRGGARESGLKPGPISGAKANAEFCAVGKLVVVDGWFNSQVRKDALGQEELFHYKWNDEANSGFSFFGRAFEGFGARLGMLAVAPTFGIDNDRSRSLRDDKQSAEGGPTHRDEAAMNGAREISGQGAVGRLDGVSVYVIASPDITAKNPSPHSMDKASGDAIEAWVRAGGVLLLMQNDKTNSEFEHFNTLSERFGIHFNAVLRNAVNGNEYSMGRLDVPANEVFSMPHQVFMKEISTITVSGVAKAIYSDKGDVLMAISRVGKGVVFACTDPWLYNEYTDGRKLPAEYDSFAAAKDLARWAVTEAGNR